MSMSINNSVSGMNAYRNMQLEKKEKEKEDKALSSGYKINEAADDAAGLAISEKMRADLSSNRASQVNASMAQGMVKTTEGAMQNINDMLVRAKELTMQSSNGILSQDNRQALQSEMSQIVEEINRVAETTNFNGVTSLDGSLSQGVDGSLEFAVDSAGSSISLSLEGASIDPSQMDITTLEQAKEILATLEEFVQKITSQRGDLGATQNRLEYTSKNLSVSAENLQSAESRIRDTDMAKSATKANERSVAMKMATFASKEAENDKNQLMNVLGS